MWGTDMKKNLGKSFLFGILSCVSFTSTYSAPLTTSISDTVSRFEVIAVDTPSIAKGSSGIQTATIKNFGPAAATNTVAEVRAAVKTGVTISNVTWGAANTVCILAGEIYSCAVGTVSNGATFDLKITYAVAQNATTSASVQQTTLAVKSNEINLGSGVGESIHRVWGKEKSLQEDVQPYGAFWAGRTKSTSGVCSSSTDCGTYSDQISSMLGFWPKDQKNPIGQYVNQSSTLVNGDSYFFDTGVTQPAPTFETIIGD